MIDIERSGLKMKKITEEQYDKMLKNENLLNQIEWCIQCVDLVEYYRKEKALKATYMAFFDEVKNMLRGDKNVKDKRS